MRTYIIPYPNSIVIVLIKVVKINFHFVMLHTGSGFSVGGTDSGGCLLQPMRMVWFCPIRPNSITYGYIGREVDSMDCLCNSPSSRAVISIDKLQNIKCLLCKTEGYPEVLAEPPNIALRCNCVSKYDKTAFESRRKKTSELINIVF